MLGSLAKVIGLSVASIGSFNAPKTAENRAFNYEMLTQDAYQVDSENYWTSDYQTPPGVPYPRTYNKSTTWILNKPDYVVSLCIIENAYLYNIGQNNELRYYTTYQGTPMTFIMCLLKVQPRTNAVVDAHYYLEIPINSIFAETGTTNTKIAKYTAIYNEESNLEYWNTTKPLTKTKNYQIANNENTFNYGTETYNRIMNSEIQYQYHTWYTYNEIPNVIDPDHEQPTIDDSPLNIPINTNGYFIYLITFENSNNYLTSSLIPTSTMINYTTIQSGNRFDINITPITGNITYDVIDVPGLCFDILTMPFTFISVAFNLTLFPGTPYQLNISWLFLTIIGMLIFVWLMTLIIGKFK